VVDDNPLNRSAFEALLEPAYTVSTAESGRQALELTLREEFAVILLDVRMPVMDGLETAELLRKRDRTRQTPIIFITSYDPSIVQIRRGYVAGATDFLTSPVDQEVLLFKVGAFAQLFLRNETLRAQINRLNSLVEALQVESAMRSNLGEGAFKSTISQLESAIQEVQRQMSASPQ
jgi:CheY-like chemotaxis protein